MESLFSSSAVSSAADNRTLQYLNQCRLYMTAFTPRSADPCVWLGFSNFTALIIALTFVFCLASPVFILVFYILRRFRGRFGSSVVTGPGYKVAEQRIFKVISMALTIGFILVLIGLLVTSSFQLWKSSSLLKVTRDAADQMQEAVSDLAVQFTNSSKKNPVSVIPTYQTHYDKLSYGVTKSREIWTKKCQPNVPAIESYFGSFIDQQYQSLSLRINELQTVVSDIGLSTSASLPDTNAISSTLSSSVSSNANKYLGQSVFETVPNTLEQLSANLGEDSDMTSVVKGMYYLDQNVKNWNDAIGSRDFKTSLLKTLVNGRIAGIVLICAFIVGIFIAILGYPAMAFYAAPKGNVKAINCGALYTWFFLIVIAAVVAVYTGVFMLSVALCRATEGSNYGNLLNAKRLEKDIAHYWKKNHKANSEILVQLVNFTSFAVRECRTRGSSFLSVAQVITDGRNVSSSSDVVAEFLSTLKQFKDPAIASSSQAKSLISGFKTIYVQNEWKNLTIQQLQNQLYDKAVASASDIQQDSADLNNYPTKLNVTLVEELISELNELSLNIELNSSNETATVYFTLSNITNLNVDAYPYDDMTDIDQRDQVVRVSNDLKSSIQAILSIQNSTDLLKSAVQSIHLAVKNLTVTSKLSDRIQAFVSSFDNAAKLPAAASFDEYDAQLSSTRSGDLEAIIQIVEKNLSPIISESPKCKFMRDGMKDVRRQSCGAVFGLRWVVLASLALGIFILLFGPFYWIITILTGKRLSKGHRPFDEYDEVLLEKRVNRLSTNFDL